MRADGIVRQVLREVEGTIHRARLNAVSAAVVALIRGGQIGLAALGRAVGQRSYKHGIKRVDRLLGNQTLVAELDLIYAAITRYVLRSVDRPVILLDWTDVGRQTMSALSAAVPMHGRAITIYSVTVPISEYAKPGVEAAFLKKLQMLLGPRCKPILVGDAGFRAPWMRQVRSMGWDFVVRIRGRTLVQPIGERRWQHWKRLSACGRRVPRSLGVYRIVRNGGIEAQLVVVDRRTRRRAITARNARAQRATQAHREPWLLATSIVDSAKLVVGIYAARMQIELTFRDLKSHRFGWGFEDARCRSTGRVAVQLLLAATASLVVMLVGIHAEASGLQRQYQANTITNRRVLSLVALGRAVLNTSREPLHPPDLWDRLPFVGIP